MFGNDQKSVERKPRAYPGVFIDKTKIMPAQLSLVILR